MSILTMAAAAAAAAPAAAPAAPPAQAGAGLAPDLQLHLPVALPSGGGLSYNVSVGGELWLVSAPLAVYAEHQWLHLRPTSPAPMHGSGSDAIGAFTSTSVTWEATPATATATSAGSSTATTVPIVTSFREYRAAEPPAIVFSLRYPAGASGTNMTAAAGTAQHSASFPAFVHSAKLPGLGFRSWSGNMCADDSGVLPLNFSQVVGTAAVSSLANGPMALYETHDGDCVFLSPHSNFMTEQHSGTVRSGSADDEPGLSFGPGGELTSLPPGFTQETILVKGRGIGATTLGWGEHARAIHGPAGQAKMPDITLSELGYWTE
jgi:hypothetical protein